MIRLALSAMLAAVLVPASAPAQQPVDTAAALQALRDYRMGCTKDGGRLWGRSLCGALVLVDPMTRVAVANQRPPSGAFAAREDGFVGRAPDDVPLANTSFEWSGTPWAVALLPLPADRYARTQLLLHEAFHRIQDGLGLRATDALNAHLDERDGRYWLRLELRALGAALSERRDDAARAAAHDALLFRAMRHRLYPGADTLERALELQEGIPEYTGTRLAGDMLGGTVEHAAAAARDFESRPTFVRSLGYGTGPLLGLLLDRWAPEWRRDIRRVREQGPAALLADALRFTPPADLAARASARSSSYGGAALAVAEDQRAAERGRRTADYRARLVEGPVLVLRQDNLMRAFNPNTLFPLAAEGTVYPTGTFSGPWGTLEVTDGGALVAPDFRMVRVPAPADTGSHPVRGSGWTLELAPGWTLTADTRRGDWTAVAASGRATPRGAGAVRESGSDPSRSAAAGPARPR